MSEPKYPHVVVPSRALLSGSRYIRRVSVYTRMGNQGLPQCVLDAYWYESQNIDIDDVFEHAARWVTISDE